MMADTLDNLQRIPRELLYIGLDDLDEPTRSKLLPLLADLPQVPDATNSAQLIGPPSITLPCLAVLARHIVQGLRDHNLTLAHDRARLTAERRKLLFYDSAGLSTSDARLARECVLCLADASEADVHLLLLRERAGLASFISARTALRELSQWRQISLS